MSANNAGGVRNLRAMFENKNGDQSTSPPSRGRSPSGSVASTSSRPVSKVRASFVAVERSGEQGQLWGLRKASDVSSMAEVQENETSIIDGPALSATRSTPEKDNNGGLGQILKGSSFAGTPMKEKPNAFESTQELSKAAPKPSADEQNKQPKANGIGARAAEAAKKIQDKAKPAVTKPNPKPIETKAPAPAKSDKPSPRTPTSAGVKPRGGVAKIKGVMDSAKKAAEGREATRKAEAEKAVPTPKSPAKTNGHKKETVQSPRATTKPAKLPSAATAPTAASAAHIHKDPEPAKKQAHSSRPGKLPSAVTATTAASAGHDRVAPDHQPKKTSRRSSAVHSSQPRLSTANTQSSLAKKASRASLADRPKSRASMAKTDDGFLARMMRPTQSSSQKTHDKTQVSSPPRAKPAAPKVKPVPRPSLTDRAHHDHAHHDHVDPAGDYASSPVSPAEAKHPKPVSTASKPKHAAKPSPTDRAHHDHVHHDHVDSAGDYAASPASPAAAGQSKPVSADTTKGQAEPVQKDQELVVEEAPMTVAEAKAPVKDTPITETAVQAQPDPEPIAVEQTPTPTSHHEVVAPVSAPVPVEAIEPVVEATPTGTSTTEATETKPADAALAEVEAKPEATSMAAEGDTVEMPAAKTAEIAPPEPAEHVSPAKAEDDTTTATKAEAEVVAV